MHFVGKAHWILVIKGTSLPEHGSLGGEATETPGVDMSTCLRECKFEGLGERSHFRKRCKPLLATAVLARV